MLHKKYPYIYQTGLMFQLFQAEDVKVEDVNTSVEELADEFFIGLADATIERWEREVGVPVIPTKSLEERRATIRAKIRGVGVTTVAMMKNVADSFTNGNVNVIENNSAYSFEINFTSLKGIPSNIEDLKKVIEQIKPAHLNVSYVYLYNRQIQLKTYNHVALSAFTHEEIKSMEIV